MVIMGCLPGLTLSGLSSQPCTSKPWFFQCTLSATTVAGRLALAFVTVASLGRRPIMISGAWVISSEMVAALFPSVVKLMGLRNEPLPTERGADQTVCAVFALGSTVTAALWSPICAVAISL